LEATTGIAGGAGNWNKGIPATSGTTQNGIFRLEPSTEALGGFGEVMDFGMNVAPNPSPSFAWIQATNKTDLSSKYLMALNPNGGNVGIAETNPKSSLDVNGNATIGTYAGVTAAPANGLTVSGQVGIGIATPNVGSALDVTSTTQGILIPRMPANPAGTATSLLYYNTISNCFMFYNGTNWQPISCGCTGAPSTPVIAGPGTFCPAGTGSYSVTPITGVLYYTWTVPTGTVITSGQGTTSINVTYGSVAGNITCTATSTCGTSNVGTLSLLELGSVPITITNSAGSATSANLPVKIIVDFTNSAYATASPALNASLNNVEFTTGAQGTGTPLYAWIESGFAPTAVTSTETTPTSSSSSAVVWVNLGATTIPAGGSVTIYMNFMAAPVMTSTASLTGMAPQWTGVYGQYDNGILVFPGFYDNFAGVGLGALAAKWTNTATNTVTLNNNLQITWVNPHNWIGIYTNTFTSALNNIAETYCSGTTFSSNGICINTSGTNGNGVNTGTDGVDAQLDGPSGAGFGFGYGGSCTSNPTTNSTLSNCSPSVSTYYVFSFWMINAPVLQVSYGNFSSLTGTGSTIGAIAPGSEVGLGLSGGTATYQWFRIRPYPPSGLLPTATVGSYGCY